MAFDAVAARDIVLPLAQAAYAVMNGGHATLPNQYVQTALIEVDADTLKATADPLPAVAAMIAGDNNVFGLIGRNPATQTTFVSFRGSITPQDWLDDFDAVPEEYLPIDKYGQVHDGFQDAYMVVRKSLRSGLHATFTAGDQILVTGHSLGAALAVLAAPDIFVNIQPTNEPRVVSFAGPRVGLSDFVSSFNTNIESCFRIVNFLDIVPLVPPAPFTHVGAEIMINSGGSILPSHRHSLDAYSEGLTNWINQHT
jgi:hypothetical protein